MKLYKATNGSIRYYRNMTKGNKNLSDNEILKKLTRNIHLADLDPSTKDEYYKIHWYGQLMIKTVGNKIVYVKNVAGANPNFKKDKEEYKRLNKLLGIKDDHSTTYKVKKWLKNVGQTITYKIWKMVG